MIKDILIRSWRIRREMWTFLGILALSALINLGAIIVYRTPWYEFFTQMGIVVTMSVVLYVLWTVLRLLAAGAVRLARRAGLCRRKGK